MTSGYRVCMWLGLGSSWLTYDKPRSRNVIINQIDNNNIIFYVIKTNATYSSETNISNEQNSFTVLSSFPNN